MQLWLDILTFASISNKKITNLSSILTIGERIAGLRKKNGYSQSALAKEIGKTRSAIAQIESNAMRPDWEFIRDLVRLFNTSYEYIFGDTEDAEPKNEKHIKSDDLEVRFLMVPGGKDEGKDDADLENEKHIKQPKAVHSMELPPEEVEGIRRAEHARRKAKMQEERQRLMSGFHEPDRAKYGDLQDAFDNTLRQQRVIFSQLLKKIEALEGNNQGNESERTGEGAELPNNGPFNGD